MNSVSASGNASCPKIIASFTLGEKEFVQASVRFVREPRWLLAIRILLIVIVACAGVLLIAGRDALLGTGILFFAFLLSITRPLLARRAAARTFRASKFLHDGITAEIDEEGTRLAYSSGTSDTKWHGYTHWSETNKVFVLFLSDRLVRVFPKRAFSDSDLTSLRALLERKLPGKEKT